MKRIYQLRDLLDIVIWGSLILIGILGLAFLYAVVFGDFSMLNFTFKGRELEDITTFHIVIMALVVIGYVFFFRALFKLKNLVSHFIKKDFFTGKTINSSKRIGFSFLISSGLFYIPPYLYQTFAEGKTSFAPVGPESFFFLIIMGLFFLALGYIFQESKKMKEENELTV
jgi:hypothetical protein